VSHSSLLTTKGVDFVSIYRRHELQKKREYGDRICEVESASFTPLVFSTTGGMGRETLTFYRRLLSTTTYSGTLAWLRCTVFFIAKISNNVHTGKPLHLF